MGIVLSVAAATTVAQFLSSERASLQRIIESDIRAARIEQTRFNRLTEAELSIRAALMDRTLNTPNESEAP